MQTTYIQAKPLAAAFFIVLFLLTFSAAVALLFSNTPQLTLGLLGCAGISIIHANHRLGRYETKQFAFRQRMLWLVIFTSVLFITTIIIK